MSECEGKRSLPLVYEKTYLGPELYQSILHKAYNNTTNRHTCNMQGLSREPNTSFKPNPAGISQEKYDKYPRVAYGFTQVAAHSYSCVQLLPLKAVHKC